MSASISALLDSLRKFELCLAVHELPPIAIETSHDVHLRMESSNACVPILSTFRRSRP